MVEDEGAAQESEPVPADRENIPEMPVEPFTPSLYSRLQEARRARRARRLRMTGALLVLAVALVLAGVAVTNGLFVQGILPVAQTGASPVAVTSTPAQAALYLVTATRTSLSTMTTPAEAAATDAPPTANIFAILAPSASATSAVISPPTATGVAAGKLPLSGRRIGLDPGHGPRGDLGVVLTDPATGKLVMSEAEFNLDVALRCRDLLVARGASVTLTRETADTFTAPWPSDANGDGVVGASGDDLQERVDILNNSHAEVFISIHANGGSASSRAGRDIQVLYCGASDCSFPAQSKQLGRFVLDQLKSNLSGAGYTGLGSQLLNDLDADSSSPPQHLFLIGPANPPRHLRATLMPGVVAESLYVSSVQQAAELNKSSVRQAIALAYANALQAYLTASK